MGMKDAEKKKKMDAWKAKQAAKQKEMEPWLNTPIKLTDPDDNTKDIETTLKLEKDKLEELKQEKRDLDKILEFGKATELMPAINEQERRTKSAEKKAKKAYKKLQKKAAKEAGKSDDSFVAEA